MATIDSPLFDVIIIGSGPSGVAAAFPLVDAGLRVLMVDGGEASSIGVPDAEYLATRETDPGQWEWMVGRDFRALREVAASSPKFRAPTLEYVFRGFGDANRIRGDGFVPVGSLATGGLSNAWGCGVARFSGLDLDGFPFPEAELLPSFEAVSRRIGISGRSDDDLSTFFGVDAWAQAPILMDALHDRLLRGYGWHRDVLIANGFRLGRARLAVLSDEGLSGRLPCAQQGFCLWGCARESLFSARFELRTLTQRSNFVHRPGLVVDRLERAGSGWRVCGRDRHNGAAEAITARRAVLAAGTLATTAIVMRSLNEFKKSRLLTLPTAAFLLWLPIFFGSSRTPAPGLAQLAFSLEGAASGTICGFTFSTHALPVVEFVRHAPLGRRNSVRIFQGLLSSTVVGNCFFPSQLTDNEIRLMSDGTVHIIGGVVQELPEVMAWARRRLAAAFRRSGAIMLPGTFKPGFAGGDAHYAGSIPMRAVPVLGESTRDAEVHGMAGVYIADGAALPVLPAKSHTLALMACADRVARRIVRQSDDDYR